MEEFGTNPDIDEKPPIPLREALEKVKPFLMVYEGIENQEQWEVRTFIISQLQLSVPLQFKFAPTRKFLLYCIII